MKNINIKKVIIFLLLFISFFLLNSCDVHAYTLGSFGGIDINTSKVIAGNNGYSTGQGYYATDPYNAKNYVEYTFCLTDVVDFYSLAINPAKIGGDPITVALKNNKCEINGQTGFVEKVYINVLQYDSQSDLRGLNLDSSIFNRHPYSISIKLIGVTSVDTISYDNTSDIINQNNTIINQNQGIINNQNKTNEELEKTNETLTDDNVNISESSITDSSASVSDSPISDLLILPIKLLNNISNGLQGTCTTFNLGNLFGTDIILPCINLESILGSFLWGLIDSLFCIFLIYNVCMLAIKIWTDVVMMEDVFRDLYKPSSEKKGGGKK